MPSAPRENISRLGKEGVTEKQMDCHWGPRMPTHQGQGQQETNTKTPARFQEAESRRNLCLLEQRQDNDKPQPSFQKQWLLNESGKVSQQWPQETVFEFPSAQVFPELLFYMKTSSMDPKRLISNDLGREWPSCLTVAFGPVVKHQGVENLEYD